MRAIRRLLHSARAKAHAQSANRLSGLCCGPTRARMLHCKISEINHDSNDLKLLAFTYRQWQEVHEHDR